MVPAAVSFAQPAAAAADCKPAKKKAHHDDSDKKHDDDHAKAPGDADQNLSQPADGCVLPQTGQAAAPQDGGAVAPVAEVGGGSGGGNTGLLIGAGVLAAVGVGVLAASGGGSKDKTPPNASPLANADTLAVNEGAASASGSVATNDSDPNGDPLTFTLTGTAPAGLTFNSNGTYTFDPANAAYNSLAQGQVQTLTVPYSVSDGKGGTASSTLTITVTGTNDLPVVTAVNGPAATEGGASVTATVNAADPDQGAVLTYSLVNPVAGVTINATTGVVTLNPSDPAYNALAAGQTQQVVVNVRATDAQGGAGTGTVTFVVTGTNDAPVVVADTNAVNEGATVTGSVATNDSDPDTGDTLTYTLNAPVAGLTLNANGTYSFDANNAAYNALAAGQTQTVVANYTASDGKGGTATSTLSIVVTGTNDAPVVANDTAAVNEDASITGNLRTNDSDPDTNDTLTYTVVGTPPAGLTVNSNGTYTFNAAQPAYQALAAGQTQTVTATIAVSDGKGGTVNQTLAITITGTNDAPIAVADVAAVNEGSTASGTVASNDSDPDTGDTLTYTLNAPVAGLTLSANGAYTFDANNAAYNSLAAGQVQTVTANYTAADGKGGTATSTLTITVTGTNDAPVVTAVAGPAATEGGAAVSATVAATDPDQNAVLTYSLVNPVAGVTINANTGVVTLDPANAAYNSLAAGQVLPVVVNVRATDAQGASGTGTVTFNVTGTNDAPVAVAATAAVTEDATPPLTGTLQATDPDTGDTLTYTVVGTPPAGFTLNANGAYTFDPTNAAYQTLTQGQVLPVVVNYQVSDGKGGTATSTLTINVTGVVETLNIDIDNDANLNTARVFDLLNTDYALVDDSNVANTVVVNNFGADDYLTLNAPFSGAGQASFANIDYDNDGIANDLRISTNNGGVVSDIILRNVLTDAQAQLVISTEAAADAAIGAGFDNFRTTTQSATPTGVSLDVDNDANLTSRYTLPVSANTGTFAYTDDGNFANTVLVQNFGGDDTITFNTAAANVSFASGDYDADGAADDIRITTNNGGVVSDIVLTNAVADGTFVSNAAQADAAIGAGFANFVFGGTVITPPPPPTPGTTASNLDVDNDGNLNTRASFDAGTAGFGFTDNADVANTVQILNFGTNDRITFSNITANNVSYANIDFDNDGFANDLNITINKGGVVSDIVIKNVIDPNAVVFTEAQAEAALGGFDYFQFA
ncbi:hypothetical protein GCM10022211_13650 [Sphingomonas humi]|uniref:Cadherin domain-containing protein n=1 Tax=Sphingomonas humi TaxID=335630 RepID=A0ABP7RWR5_9SPHN